MLVLVALPLSVVFAEAFSKGVSSYFAALSEPNALSAIRLTLLVAAIAVPFNVVFGVVASWAITKFEFVGKRLLITFIDLPFSVSPIISGLIYVLLFGAHGFMGEWLYEHDIQIIFAVPALAADVRDHGRTLERLAGLVADLVDLDLGDPAAA